MAVYTPIDAAQLENFLLKYDLGSLVSHEGISAGIENTNYFVDTTKGQFVLTVFEQHTAQELEYFISLMGFMARQGIPTALPYEDKSGVVIQQLENKPAALVERLKGKTYDRPNLEQIKQAAKYLAKFHVAGFEFGLYRANDRDLNWAKQLVQEIEPLMTAEDQVLVGSELAFQESIDWSGLPQSVMHADLFCDNAMFDGDKLTGIIDLYYACHGACIYDFAVMVNDWCRTEDNQLDQEKLDACWQAYQIERKFTLAENQAWLPALRMASLRFWLSRMKDKLMPREGEITFIKDPQVFKDLLLCHRETRN